MNKLIGTITAIESHEGLSLVKVKTQEGLMFTSIVLDDPGTVAYLQIGKPVDILFKETEVIISKDFNLNISIQNRIFCTIKSVTIGVILGQVDLLCEETMIRSIITGNACKQLELKEDDNVLALIKTNEISLSPHD